MVTEIHERLNVENFLPEQICGQGRLGYARPFRESVLADQQLKESVAENGCDDVRERIGFDIPAARHTA